ncbi:MAG: zinc and cadmium transporter [Candidatus Woesearchaeota archaeon]|jgi:zinc and cadmium transporter
MSFLYALIATLIVSLIPFVVVLPFLKKEMNHAVLLTLMSFAVGTLLGTVFLNFLPESFEHLSAQMVAILAVGGFVAFIIIEKIIHAHHEMDHNHEHNHEHHHEIHSHAYHLAPLNLIADGLHNFIDGIVIGVSFLVSVPVGIATTVSIALHELPQEIADFGILLYAGYSKKKAILYNALSGALAFAGTALAFLLSHYVENFHDYFLPVGAGIFIYIAAANLVPELHRGCGWRESVLHIGAVVVGFLVILGISLIFAH